MPARTPVQLTIRRDPDTGEFYAISYADGCLLVASGKWWWVQSAAPGRLAMHRGEIDAEYAITWVFDPPELRAVAEAENCPNPWGEWLRRQGHAD